MDCVNKAIKDRLFTLLRMRRCYDRFLLCKQSVCSRGQVFATTKVWVVVMSITVGGVAGWQGRCDCNNNEVFVDKTIALLCVTVEQSAKLLVVTAMWNERGWSRITTLCLAKNGFEYKELIDFYYKVEISPNKKIWWWYT